MSEFSDNVKHRLIGVGLLNLENKPELLEILQCYFSGIWGISDIVVYEKNIFTTIYTYPNNYDLEYIFNKFEQQCFNYIKSISLILLNQNSDDSYRYISIFNSGLSAYVDKHKLDQYLQDCAIQRRLGFNKNGYI
ncbi:MAG: hypothetical protein IIW92_12495 [Lachnospiraceae bacterium]|nr:hypothetical protein [Lachnospiraceae bacterium]MBQ5919373.1 hypothetical protein [Lachnospiraceae bacterium]